jgi:hypothetical protein
VSAALKNAAVIVAHAVVVVVAAGAAAVPGVLVLRGRIRVPPGLEDEFAFGSWALGVVLVLALLALQRDPFRASRKTVLRRVGLSVVLFLFTLFVSIYLQHRCWIEIPDEWREPDDVPAYFPLWLDGNLAHLVDQAKTRSKAMQKHGPLHIKNELKDVSDFAWWCTTAVMLATFVGNSASIAVALASLGFLLVRAVSAGVFVASTFTGEQARQLQGVLVSAFTHDDLAQVMRFDLNERLDAIVQQDAPLIPLAFQLVNWLDRQGRDTVVKFLIAIEKRNSGNQEVQRVVPALLKSLESAAQAAPSPNNPPSAG